MNPPEDKHPYIGRGYNTNTNNNTNINMNNNNNAMGDPPDPSGSDVGVFANIFKIDITYFPDLTVNDNNGEVIISAPTFPDVWELLEIGPDLYRVLNLITGRYMGLAEESTDDNVPLVTYAEPNATTQWLLLFPLRPPSRLPPLHPIYPIVPAVQFLNDYSTKVMEVPGYSTTPGTQMVQFTRNPDPRNTRNQLFDLLR